MTNEDQLAALLREAGKAHDLAFLDVNGEDPEWPAWYAGWLAPRLGPLLDRPLDVAQLAVQLAQLEEERTNAGAGDWPRYYAARMLASM